MCVFCLTSQCVLGSDMRVVPSADVSKDPYSIEEWIENLRLLQVFYE